MEFSTIDEIKEHFGIEANNNAELRKLLKQRLLNAHSDITNGEYKSKIQKRDHEEIQLAIDFIDNNGNELVLSKKEWLDVKSKIDELSIIRKKESFEEKEKKVALLKDNISYSITKYKKNHLSLKVSSLAVTSLITAIWAFPLTIGKNVLLNDIPFFKSTLFFIIWLFLLGLTSFIWIYTKSIEKKDSILKQNFLSDSTQDDIFKLFCAWIRNINYKKFDSDKKTYNFSRNQLYNFILNHYKSLHEEYEEITELTDIELFLKIATDYKGAKELLVDAKSDSFKDRLLFFFSKPGEIDIELANNLTDIMIDKLLIREMIKIENKQAFSDIYSYKSTEA